MRKLRDFVVLWWVGDLLIVSRCPGIFPCCGGLTTGSGVLCVVRGSHGPVDVEALPRRFVAVVFEVRIWLGGVEASASLLR